MPRLPRTVFAGIPHHVTQRGNRREPVFFSDSDRRIYLDWLLHYCGKHEVEILAYCLMPNHVHLVVVPSDCDGLHRALRPLHMRHAQRINRERDWKGHLWQGRFYSSAMDEAHLWSAVRYVERNPVRAGLARRAEWYRWSSAAGHSGLRVDPLLARDSHWHRRLDRIPDWAAWLAEGDPPDKLDILRRHVDRGLPCGSPAFIERLEALSGRSLRDRPRGRPFTTGPEKKKG